MVGILVGSNDLNDSGKNWRGGACHKNDLCNVNVGISSEEMMYS